MPMTSRERIRKYLNREPVDRLPNALGGCETTGLHVLAYDRLKKVLGVSDTRTRICTFMTNAIFEPSVINAMEGDTILLSTGMNPARFWGPEADGDWKTLEIWDRPIDVAKAWSFRQDEDGTWWWGDCKCPKGSFYFDSPYSSEFGRIFDDKPQPDPKDFNPPRHMPESRLKALAEQARFLYDTTELSIVCGETIHDLQLAPGGQQAWWMRMVTEPDACHEYLDKAVDAALSQLQELEQAVGKYCDILVMAHDFGDINGVSIGPKLWREIYKPHYSRLFQGWKQITRMKSALHTCGSVADILGDLIDCGLDIYNPVQTSAKGMDPGGLKEKFGQNLIFWGGALDMVQMPPNTPRDQVYESVLNRIGILGKGGGYLFAGVHNLPGDIPESHLEAMIQAWMDARD